MPHHIVIKRSAIARMAKGYDSPRIGVLGSHSALEVMDGAKDEGFETVVFCQRGREAAYRRFSRIADEIIVLDKFSGMASKKMQDMMVKTQTILVPHRSLTAYLGYDTIEQKLQVPIFGNRSLFQAEERGAKRGQYYLLKKAKIKYPRVVQPPKIRGPVIVKVQEKRRKLERAFFTASSYEDYKNKAAKRIKSGLISEAGLKEASIEELAIGTYMNFNYFYTPVSGTVDFIGIERRLQTNIHDYNALPAIQQAEIGEIDLQNIEVGHTPASIRESLLEKVIYMGDRFVRAVKREYPPGIIGPFSLQSVITKDLDLVVYDVSLRVPGNPIVATTSPYTKYRYGQTFGVGRRIAMEIGAALDAGRLADVLT